MIDMRRLSTDKIRLTRWYYQKMGYDYVNMNCAAIGVIDDDKGVVAACLFNHIRHSDIEIHVAAEKYGMTRQWIRECCRYVFLQLGLNRVTGYIAANNMPMILIAEKYGFRQEGVKRRVMPDGTDQLIYGLLREDCKCLS